MRRAWLLGVTFACSACMHDFDAFLPQDDAAVADADASSVDGALETEPVDTGCVLDGGQSCFSTARACSGNCQRERFDCERDCSNGACRKACRDDEAACKKTCADTCTSCTESLGCAAPSRCADAAD